MMDKFDRMSAYDHEILKYFEFNMLKRFSNSMEIIA